MHTKNIEFNKKYLIIINLLIIYFRIDVSLEATTISQGVRTSQPLRRRTTTIVESKPTEKTVLKIDTNSEIQIPRNTLDITSSKNTATDIERDTLIANRHLHDDDDDINHIALPTESVTENILPPDSVTTTQNFNTFSPQFNANENKVNDILNEVVDGTTEISDFDLTTISNENIADIIDDGLSKQNNDLIINRQDNTVPRPFTRPKLFQKTTSSPSFSRNSISRSNNNNLNDNIYDEQTTKIVRRRPTITRTSTTVQANDDEDAIPKPRPTYSYRPGYRGTARFRVATTRSGEYVQDSLDSKVQLVDDNRLRSLNIDRVNKRPPISTTTTTERIIEEGRTTRRRPTVTRSRITSTTASEENEETTTESKILEAKNRFSLDANERPDKIRFELSAGGKINFPEIVHKKAQIENNSKVKVITGPLNKSPIEFSIRETKKGHVEEIPIQTSPETVTIQNFSDKLDLNEIPLNKSDIESFVSDSDLRTESSIVEETTFTRKRLRPSKIGVKTRIEGGSSTVTLNEENESTTRKSFFSANRSSFKTRSRTKLTETSQFNVNQQRSRLLTRTTQRQETDSTTARYLTKIKVSDLPQKNNLSIEDSENSETQDAPEESTLRSYIEAHQEDTTIDLDVLDMITEKSLDNEYENEITTLQNGDYEVTENSAPETTLRTVPARKLTIRKRPAKKIDFLAHRQTITEPVKDFGITPEIESTSSLSLTTENDNYETEIETVSEKETSSEKEYVETTSNKPTRRVFLTRKRVNENRISTSETKEQENVEIEKQSTTPRTTRRRILTIKTKTGVIQSPVEVGNYETTEPSTEASVEEKPKKDDTDVIRKRIKVYRSRATTETVTEGSSTHKPIVTRTRVFKRPVTKQTETPEINSGIEDETSTSDKPRYTQSRRVIKVTRRPFTQKIEVSTTDEEKEEEHLKEEKQIESSTIANQKTGVRKVLRTKTPRVIVEKPIEEDQIVIKTDEEIQQIDQIEEKLEEDIPIENQAVSLEEPSSPIIKYPTRPAGRVSVTIKKRPSFNQGSRTTTIHPASTRFTKEGEPIVQPTRSRIGTRKTYRPGFRNQESAVEESEQEIKPSFGKGTKKFFTKPSRKTSTTTTVSPNITPHNNIDIETETNDYDGANDITDIPDINNNNDILQTGKPRFPLSRYTTSTTSKPTTLHHVFAIDIEEGDMNKLKNANIPENQADEVIKKLQKLIEINRIVEVYSKEEKLKLLKNKKLKSIKAGELTLERPPALDKFGEITRQVIIKLSVKPNVTASVNNVSTENPNDNRSPKNIMFSETVFGKAETSTISLEGLFDQEKKDLEMNKDEISTESSQNLIAELEQAIRDEVQQRINKNNEDTTTESLETTTLVNDD